MPEFSIVISTYNRQRLLLRALDSCMAQRGASFEVVVVDDGSNDGSDAAVESLHSPLVTMIRHEVNRGHSAALNTGIDAARGEWIVVLDSDDELLPGALSRMSQAAAGHGASVDRLAFMYRRDDGGISPNPPLQREILDYAGILRSLENRRYFDFLQCIRRSSFATVRWREWKYAGHLLFLMDFAEVYRTYSSDEFLGIVHTDAPDRLSWLRRAPAHALQSGRETGEEMDLILSRHGEALAMHAPCTLQRFLRVRASYCFLAGDTIGGIRRTLHCLRETPFSGETWLQLATGLAGRAVFAHIRSLRPPPT